MKTNSACYLKSEGSLSSLAMKIPKDFDLSWKRNHNTIQINAACECLLDVVTCAHPTPKARALVSTTGVTPEPRSMGPWTGTVVSTSEPLIVSIMMSGSGSSRNLTAPTIILATANTPVITWLQNEVNRNDIFLNHMFFANYAACCQKKEDKHDNAKILIRQFLIWAYKHSLRDIRNERTGRCETIPESLLMEAKGAQLSPSCVLEEKYLYKATSIEDRHF